MKFAIGSENGLVTIKEKENDKEVKAFTISPGKTERIWALTYSATRHKQKDYTLIVGTWEKRIYLIELLNYTTFASFDLPYDPVCLSLYRDDYFLIGTNDYKINFYSKEGVFISAITEEIDDWVIKMKPDNKNDSFVACTNSGKMLYYNVNFMVVHAIHAVHF